MKINLRIILCLLVCGLLILGFFFIKKNQKEVSSMNSDSFLKISNDNTHDFLVAAPKKSRIKPTLIPTVPQVGTNFIDSFSETKILEETGSIDTSASSAWWLNSGGQFITQNGIGSTIQDSLPLGDRWQKEYASSNPEDTDDGYHPQNIFRLVQRYLWQSFTQEVYVKINAVQMSASENRNASNGVLLFNRYQGGDNLYYAGIRVDGAVVIKKKYNGIYYTLAYKKIFNTSETYNKDTNPNLVPEDEWIGIRTIVKDLPDGSVSISLFTDVGRAGVWKEVLSATDTGGVYGSDVIRQAGYAGIRTDFMDASFEDYSIKAL